MRRARTPNISPTAARPFGTLSARLCGATLAAGLALLGPGLAAQADAGAGAQPGTPASSASESQTDEETAGEESAGEAPAGEKPAAENPASEAPAAEEPVAGEPAAEEPASDGPASDEPGADEPAAEKPASDGPASGEPTSGEPASDASADNVEASDAAASQPLPDTFSVAVVPTDADGNAVVPYPEGFTWSITATGPVTYQSDDVSMALTAIEPVAGTYRLDVALNDTAAAQMTLSDVVCTYMTDLADPDTLELDLGYQIDGDWYVDVRAAHATSCVFLYDVSGPLPDPSFELTTLLTMPGVDADGDRVSTGESSDFAVALVASDGTIAGTVGAGGKVQVPPGEYIPTLVASAAAQPGFDVSAWKANGWNCLGAQSTSYGSTITLEPGGVVACNTVVSDAGADLSAAIAESGGVEIGWNGVNGPVGTEFDIIVDIEERFLSGLNGGPIDDLQLVLTMGDNVALVDPAFAPEGWRLVSAEDGMHTFAMNGSFAPGQDTTLSFRAVITAAEAGSPVRACVSAAVVEPDRQNNCAALEAIADGGGDPEEPPTDPEDPDTEEPEEPEEPDTEDPDTEEPDTPDVEQPDDDAQSDDPGELARTGSDAVQTLPFGIAAVGAMILGALLMTVRVRRN